LTGRSRKTFLPAEYQCGKRPEDLRDESDQKESGNGAKHSNPGDWHEPYFLLRRLGWAFAVKGVANLILCLWILLVKKQISVSAHQKI
jgi:hypothetical protein